MFRFRETRERASGRSRGGRCATAGRSRFFRDSLALIDMQNIDGVPPTSASDANRVMVSNAKKPLFHYVRLAEKFLAKHDVVTLCGIGAAVATAASVSEILKAQASGYTVTRVHTGMVTHVDQADPDVRSRKSTLEIDLKRVRL
jgi:DNA-binding protein